MRAREGEAIEAVILAAGKGTRMKSGRPKVLHELCGRPMIHYVLQAAAAATARITVVVGHGGERIERHLRETGFAGRIVVQRRLLGTADAVRCAVGGRSVTRGGVLILNGDAPLLTPTTVRRLVREHARRSAAVTFLTAEVEDPSGYGRVLRDGRGRVTAIREERDLSAVQKRIREVNVGVYCVQARALASVLEEIPRHPRKKEYFLTDAVGLLAERGASVETIAVAEEEGLGVNSRADLARLGAILRRRTIARLMDRGVTVEDPGSAHIAPDARIGLDTVIRPFTVIEPDVRIGRGCVIGPFARLRPGTRIADGVQVGNFAEVSRSRVGTGTLMKHFGFLGDARVGAGANIGAGAVTANYDGRAKHRTVIREGAFIGSDSILVAPVTVGRRGTTAAGSVVTGGTVVPEGGLVMGVPARLRTGGGIRKPVAGRRRGGGSSISHKEGSRS